MSTQERPRDRDKPKKQKADNKETQEPQQKSIDSWLDSFDPDELEDEQTAEVTKEQVTDTEVSDKLDTLLAEFTRNLPAWINKPWMYVKPTHEGHLASWYESWKNLILSYTEQLTQHIINIYDLQEIHPFTNKNSGRELTSDQLRYLIEEMISENLAKWLSEERIRARIYFKTDEELAAMLYQFTLDEGYALDVMTFYELKKFDQPWAVLPDEELRSVLNILVKQDKAEWVGSEHDTVQFKI